MDWIEIIHLKSFSRPDNDSAVKAFQEIFPLSLETGLKGIELFRSLVLENELTIYMNWQSGLPDNGRSRVGIQLARAFSEFGQIYHSGWQRIVATTNM